MDAKTARAKTEEVLVNRYQKRWEEEIVPEIENQIKMGSFRLLLFIPDTSEGDQFKSMIEYMGACNEYEVTCTSQEVREHGFEKVLTISW